MTFLTSYNRTQKALIIGGLSLWILASALVVRQGFLGVAGAVRNLLDVPQSQALPSTLTTCATYTNDSNCGNTDCGFNTPLADDGGFDADCDTPQNANNVCYNNTEANGCFCQERRGTCTGVCDGDNRTSCNNDADCSGVGGPCVEPLAVVSNVTEVNPGEWWAYYRWVTNVDVNQSCAIAVQDDGAHPQPWRCVWDSGYPGCNALFRGVYCRGAVRRLVDPSGPFQSGYTWYYGAQSFVVATGRELHSEVRSFQTFSEDYQITVAPPADIAIVTGETTQDYTITVTPAGNPTGRVNLSITNWNPGISGQTIQWEGNAAYVDLDGTNNPKIRKFRIQTDDGAPPTWPPLTQANVYTFTVHGSHATIGDRDKVVPNGLTVQDYNMTTTTTDITMDANGDNDSFTVNMGWFPGEQPFEDSVNLTNTNIAGLTVSFSNYTPPLNNADLSFRVNLSTNNVAPGNYPFTVTGRGTNPGQLWREVPITLHISGPPDFTFTMAPEQINANQGGNAFFFPVELRAVNSPPGGMAIQLSSESHPWPNNPDDGNVGRIFKNQTGAEITSVTLPESGNPVQIYLYVYPNAAADCDNDPNPPEYAIKGIGTYVPGGITHDDTDNLHVICAAQPSFEMTANPISQSVAQGGTATYEITVTSVNGFDDNVDLYALVTCPTGATCNYPSSPGHVGPGAPWVFNFAVITNNPGTPIDVYNMELFGEAVNDPSTRDSVLMTLDVGGAPDYTFTIQPSPLNINEGSSGAYTVTVNGQNGFSTPIRFTWTDPGNPNILFNPTSGNLVVSPGENKPIDVTANPGSAGSYTLNFTATPQGPGNVKNLNGVQLVITSTICTGDCPNVCVDAGNVPLVPEVQCNTDTDCPAGSRCASQTCRGVDGCQPDPPPGPLDCNESSCYNPDGSFQIPAPDGCYQSWPRCLDYQILKVRKDRQCQEWLSCEDSVQYQDPTSRKDITQCLNLGVCNQLGQNGECTNLLPPSGKTNQQFASPTDVTGDSSKIRWYSGYSSGFEFKDSNTIEATYPKQDIEETGLDGATKEDLVRNGTFEELRCTGGPRHGLSCILPSDCRVGQGRCAQFEEPGNAGAVSGIACTDHEDCDTAEAQGNIDTPKCRYLLSKTEDVTCDNPRDSNWMGVVPPGAGTEAGFDDARNGIKFNGSGQTAVTLQVRENDENFKNLAAKQTGVASARHPAINNIAEDHVKDGNNVLRIRIKKDAERFSGIGIPILDPVQEDGLGYVLTFKFRYVNTGGDQEKIKAQLAFNYTEDGDNFQNSNPDPDDFELTPGVKQIPGTTDWQTFVLGPVIPSDFNTDLTPFLNFVTDTDQNLDDDTVFEIDDVTLKPVLETKNIAGNPLDTVKLERRCRAFPKGDAPECDYFDENFARYKGWRGYCLDKDPQNQDLCLTWWPLDLLAGESPYTIVQSVGYDDRAPLYYCLQAEGGPTYGYIHDDRGGDYDFRSRWEWTSGGLRHEGDENGWGVVNNTPIPQIRWRDVERIVVNIDANAGDWNGLGEGTEYGAEVVKNSGTSEYMVTLKQNVNFSEAEARWGFGGTCLKGDCDNRFNGSFIGDPNTLWRWNCQGGEFEDYIAVGVDLQGNDPDDPASLLAGVRVKLCAERPFENDIFHGPEMSIAIYARQSCNAVAEVVQSPQGGGRNKAWVKRTDQTSSFLVPDLNYGYLNESAPFGAARGPDGAPSEWPDAANTHFQLDGISVAEPTASGQNPRLGTPYSCRRDCGGGDPKYCYSSGLPSGPCGGADCQPTGTGMRCETRQEISQCLGNTDASCIGVPLGRCSNNRILACSTDADCGVGATCDASGIAAGSSKPNLDYARDRLKKLFAKSYECYQPNTDLQTIDGRTVAVWSYEPGCTDPAGKWDVMAGTYGTPDDGDPEGGYCPGNSRNPNDFCALRPTIKNGTFLINSLASGDITVSVNQPVRATFQYSIDAEQRPMYKGTVVWLTGGGSADDACKNSNEGVGTPDTGTVLVNERWSSPAGPFRPIACIEDNWGAVGYFEFPGTVTVQ